VFEKGAKVRVETNLKEMFDEVKAFLGCSYFNADTKVQIMNLFLID
jgi:glucan biosynthesis protein